jgi:cystathionine beta-lyase
MITYDFDTPIDRTHTLSEKWERYAGRDIIPMWVADMDFAAAPPILEAMNRITAQQVLGYTRIPPELTEVAIERLRNRHQWEVPAEWIVWLPGLIPGISLTYMIASAQGDEVMTTVPVYGPFMKIPVATQRNLIKVPLTFTHNRWTLDFDAIEAAITPRTKLFILCNPYNPGGTVFTKAELEKLGTICAAHNITICSDEIHCDLLLDPAVQHTSIASISPEIAQQTITLLSPSKTFNIPGLGCSFAVIPNNDTRKKFTQLRDSLVPMISPYASQGALAAYRDGGEWHAQLLQYLRRNHDYLLEAINTLPGFVMHPHAATYLAWIDVRQSGIPDIDKAFENAGVGISEGKMFFDGAGFIRLNFGTQFSLLQEAVTRIKTHFG